MGLLSKFLIADQALEYNCYEVIHTWSPYCSEAALQMSERTFLEALRIYGPLFLLSQASGRHWNFDNFIRTGVNIFRSSTFLTLNAYFVISLFCAVRYLSGKFYYPLVSWIPGILSSWLAIQVERPSRRSPLAFYVLNIASQTLLNRVRSGKKIANIWSSLIQMLVLISSTTYTLNQAQRFGYSKDLLGSLLRWLLGPLPESHSEERTNEKSCLSSSDDCPHNSTCTQYLLIGFLKPLITLGVIQMLMQVALKPQSLLDISQLWQKIRTPGFFGTSFCVASYALLFKATGCTLRRRQASISMDNLTTFCSLAASPALLIAPSTPFTLYVMWRALQTKYNRLVDENKITYRPFYIDIVYSLATAFLFQTAVLDPQHIRPSYLRFLNRVTNNAIVKVNRALMGNFMPDSVQASNYPLRPLDLEFVSRHYYERIHTWQM